MHISISNTLASVCRLTLSPENIYSLDLGSGRMAFPVRGVSDHPLHLSRGRSWKHASCGKEVPLWERPCGIFFCGFPTNLDIGLTVFIVLQITVKLWFIHLILQLFFPLE